MTIDSGTRLGRYEIKSKVGEGGMGEVYLALDTSELGRTVALKIVSAEVAKDKDRLQRFTQEARTVSNLNHPNILTIYEFGQTDAVSFIASEFVDGMTLRQHLSNRRLKLIDVLDVAIQIVGALNAAHEAGVTHRDLKPENVMVRKDHIVKVLDFGLAKLTQPSGATTESSGSEVATRLQVNTTPGLVMGTVSYMSPEQSVGGDVDHRTDIWSAGIVLYEMIAGCVPFQGKDVHRQIIAIQESDPAPLSQQVEGVPDRLEEIVLKCLAKEKDERYQTAKDLLIDLRNLRRKLDVDAEIERTVAPAFRSTSAGQSPGTQSVHMSAGTTASAAQVSTASSAEYVVTGIKRHKLAAVIALLLLVSAGVGLVLTFRSRSIGGAIDSIAVLPFDNRSNDANTDYLSDGLAESLIYRLSQLPNLKVSPTSSVMRYKGKATDVKAIATELGVNAVLTGRMAQLGDNLTISVELVDVRNNKLLWGEQYERKMSDLLATQREIAATIAEKLQLKLSGEDARGVTKKYTDSNEAYQLYLKGRFQWNKRTVEGLRAAETFYKQAIERDPSFALAYAGLAETYVIFSNYSVASPKDSNPLAKVAAQKALELDASLAEPHAALGLYHAGYSWDLEAAVRELYRATELNPKYATAYHWIGNTLPIVGRCDEAIAAGRKAEELDPLSPIISADTAFDMVMCRRFDDALAQTQKALKMDPSFYYTYMIAGFAYNAKGNYKEAVVALRRSRELNPDPYATALFIQALVGSGERSEAAKLRDDLRAESRGHYIEGYILAIAEAATGDHEAAYVQLERALVERGGYGPFVAIDPTFDQLRDDPRFNALVKKIQSSKIE